jgi:Transposase DDE domain
LRTSSSVSSSCHAHGSRTATLRKSVAKDPRISIEDAQMRHGHESRSVRVDSYKRHVLRDLDSGLVRGVGITPANVAEATVTPAISLPLLTQTRII